MLKLKKGHNSTTAQSPARLIAPGSHNYMQQTTTSTIKKNINLSWKSTNNEEFKNPYASRSAVKNSVPF